MNPFSFFHFIEVPSIGDEKVAPSFLPAPSIPDHCKNLEPKYLRLAEHFASSSGDVVIAQMETLANEIEEYKAEKHPDLVLFSREDNKVVVYRGEPATNLLGASFFFTKQA